MTKRQERAYRKPYCIFCGHEKQQNELLLHRGGILPPVIDTDFKKHIEGR